jgi:tetraacyldisaccharide 4'-kinase
MFSPQFINELWYGKHPLSLLLAPLGWLYKFFMTVRRLAYQAGLLPVKRVNVPVIIVGNITAGGTGKTPLVIWLAEYLKKHNFRPGIVSRGYGGSATHWPQQVRPDSDPVMVGDEPIVIARHTGCPVAASPDRYTAVVQLLEHQDCNIIICDDGLQHHALARDIEIAVIDAVRRFGNGRCIPAGPLRESLSRLKSVDMVVSNGKPGHGEYPMEYVAKSWRALIDPEREIPAESFRDKTVHAVAGIGHPARFFSMLRACGMGVIEHEFPDHHRFSRRDICFGDDLPVVMTEKDAVKCMSFAEEYHWYLEIDVRMNNIFEHRFSNLLKDITDGQKAA